MTSEAGRVDIAVRGGSLATYRLGSPSSDAPLALAIHGITSSSRSWLAVASALGDRAALVAVDLRGRGRSNELPEPFGIATHVRDMVAVLDEFGLERAVVVGHSLGAYIACALAAAHPDRVGALVLVDGGLTVPASVGADPEEFLQTFLAAALARMKMTFPDRESYRAWWRTHPAFAAGGVDDHDLDQYADHDLVGEPPDMRCAVNPEVVRADAVDLFRAGDARSLQTPAVLLCAPRGLVDDPNPMQPLAIAQEWAAQDPARRRAVQVPDVNHYTIAIGRRGARIVANEMIRALEPTGSEPTIGHTP